MGQIINTSMSWVRRLGVGLSPPGSWVNPSPVHVRFLVDEMAVGRFYLQVLRFYPVTIIPPMTHTHSLVCQWRYVNRLTVLLNNAIKTINKYRLIRGTPMGRPWGDRGLMFSCGNIEISCHNGNCRRVLVAFSMWVTELEGRRQQQGRQKGGGRRSVRPWPKLGPKCYRRRKRKRKKMK